jgi:uncharacterized protein (TIGR02996 family)
MVDGTSVIRATLTRAGEGTAMSVEEVFLRDVLDQPEEDAPRLIYADWLTDQLAADKAARGDFIRLQCQRAALPPDDPDGPEMQALERQLLAEHQLAWLGELGEEIERCEFHRGFVEGVTMTASAFLARIEEVYALGPIRRLHLREAASLLGLLGSCERLATLTHLSLRENGYIGPSLPPLVASPHLNKLTVLDLSRNPLGRVGVEALVSAARLPALQELNLTGTEPGADGIDPLFWGLSRTLEAPHRALGARVTRLRLADNSLGEDGAEALAGRIRGTTLDLDLSRNRFGVAGLTNLVGGRRYMRGIHGVHRLDLSGNDIHPAGAEALASRHRLRSLTALTLNHNALGDDGADALVTRNSSPLDGLRELSLAGNGIGPAGMRALLGLRCLPTLTRLELDNNRLGADGAYLITSHPALAGLTHLGLGRNRLGPAGVENLVALPILPRLTRLDVSGNGIGVRGVQALLDAPHLERLVELNVSGNRLDPEQVRRLRTRFGARVRA